MCRGKPCASVSFDSTSACKQSPLGTRTVGQLVPRNRALTHRGAHGVIWLQRFLRFGLVLCPDTAIVGSVYSCIQILDGEPHGAISVPAEGSLRISNCLKQKGRSTLSTRNHAGGAFDMLH